MDKITARYQHEKSVYNRWACNCNSNNRYHICYTSATIENIIDIYNGASIRVINIDTDEIIYDGNKTDFVLDSGYELIDVSYSDWNVTIYVKILE